MLCAKSQSLNLLEHIGRKKQLESGKSGEKSHNEGEGVGRNRILKYQPKDSPPW
jgi:hypothetical protein